MDDFRTIGARIRQARLLKGLTQVDLAAAIGVSRAHLTNVEGGHGGLALDKLSALAHETGTTVAWLIGEAGPTDSARLAWLAAYDALDAEDRATLLRAAQGLMREKEVALPVRPKGPAPPRPFPGGSVAKNVGNQDCDNIIQLPRVPA